MGRWGTRVSTSFLKHWKSPRFLVERLSLEWRESSPSVAVGKDQVVYRSDARALIKWIPIFSENGSQGYLTDWDLLRAWEERWARSIHWRVSENYMKEWSEFQVGWVCRLLHLARPWRLWSGGDNSGLLSSWVVTWTRCGVHQNSLETSLFSRPYRTLMTLAFWKPHSREWSYLVSPCRLYIPFALDLFVFFSIPRSVPCG